MAGVVEQPHGLRPGPAQALAEVPDRARHAPPVGVLCLDHLETHPPQGLGHERGIILGIGERRDQLVIRIADHQRHARLGPRGRQAWGRKNEREK